MKIIISFLYWKIDISITIFCFIELIHQLNVAGARFAHSNLQLFISVSTCDAGGAVFVFELRGIFHSSHLDSHLGAKWWGWEKKKKKTKDDDVFICF